MTDITSFQFQSVDKNVSKMDVARLRLIWAIALFSLGFMVLIGRTLELGLADPVGAVRKTVATKSGRTVIAPVQMARADIVDRNGEILATNLETSSLAVDATMIKDPKGLARKLAEIIPDVPLATFEKRLSSGKKFVWLKRKLSPAQKWKVNALGEVGLKFEREEERIYPHGRLAAHVLGYVDVDGNGLAGLEHYFDDEMKAGSSQVDIGDRTLRTSLDIRVQFALADELSAAMRAHSAVGGAGLVMDVKSGEVIAMVSLPDYDPNDIRGISKEALFNRATKGVYELGSTFKTFTFAAALDEGVVTLNDGYDATKPLRISRFLIQDDHPKARYLSVPEIFTYSSNIGTAQMALDLGTERQQEFLNNIGLLQPAPIEITEVGAPMYPTNWRKVSTMTISYGHGIAVSPLQLATGISAMVNGGRLIPATLIHQTDGVREGKQVIKPSTSRQIRQLLRMVVKKGTGSKASAIGYRVGGKTGTAEKAAAGGYNEKLLISSFVGAFPMDDPQYVVFALLDEPKGIKETHGFRGGGWTAAPVVKNVILRASPILGIAPKEEDEGLYRQIAMKIHDDKKR
ncbi:peptidoglycan glycosyltransferase [Kordiimonas sediminis]|uniref:Peptidoglycan glycosyltransferase n=1 Tax=Kordiimonas sediminis TaxID=1735581 RepID=A0A919AT82_9PROT|nr:penicillin-binding protein 2 [Kordiimonas sediminis]GHF23105.1 peptidoglycan glycosyltransferase [Kordiimonas sediminis]